jgi:AcrR family transcriptional regulator
MSSQATPQVRRQGRPRDPGADEAILSATLDLVTDQGFGGLTVEAVAARAGVGKATIYRRWATREELLIAATERLMLHEELPDNGSLRDDLVSWYWEKFRTKAERSGDRLMALVIAEATANPELKALLTQFISDRRRAVSVVVDRALERGEIDASVDSGLLMDLVAGTLLHRSLFGDRSLRRVDVERVVDAALAGVRAEVAGT